MVLVLREEMLSMKEADRASVIGQVAEKRLGRREAAERLGLSVRQVKRLLARYRERGSSGLVSGHRGKPSNNAIDDGVRREVVGLVRERYPDFGPTFARRRGRRGSGTPKPEALGDGLPCSSTVSLISACSSQPALVSP